MGDLVVRSTWLSRLLQRAGILAPTEHVAGTDFGAAVAAEQGYSALQSMSAFAAFPWVKACVNAKAVDLSGLPLKLTRGVGSAAVEVDAHEVLDLLDTPSTRVGGLLFRRQMWVDLDLTGNWYGLMLGGPRPASVLRLHPHRVSIKSMPDGQVDFYQYDKRGGSTPYAWESVLHMRGPSWEDDPTGLFGTGLIRALHNDLTADLAAQKTSATAARKGRPDAVIRPKDNTDRWTPAQAELIKQSVNQKLADAEGGVLILGASADYSPLSWSPKDMEFQALRLHVREAVLAASGVPPSRVSLPTANYAQSDAMDRTYWQALKGEAALIDAELTRLARLWDPSFKIAHDFSGVPALQVDRTAQVQRVHQWWVMGLSLPDAAAFEGFDDLPAAEALPARPTDTTATTQQGLEGWWRSAPLTLADDPATREEARAVKWRSFIDRIHAPVERGLTLELRRYFQEQAAGINERLVTVLGREASAPAPITRDLSDEAWAFIFDDMTESERLAVLAQPHFRLALQQAFAAAMVELGLEVVGGDDLPMAEKTLTADLITRVSQTTKDSVTEIVRAQLATGGTIAEMQAAIVSSVAFSPSRALLVARTETTRAVNKGKVEGYREAVHDVPDLKMQWLSARDDASRPSHWNPADPDSDMDGKTAEVDGVFTSASGLKAAHPGDFGDPAEDCNCRCTVLPYFAEVS